MSAAPTAADAAADSEERAARQARVLRQQKMAADAKWSDPSYGSDEAGTAAAAQTRLVWSQVASVLLRKPPLPSSRGSNAARLEAGSNPRGAPPVVD